MLVPETKIPLPIVILGISQISQVAREGWLAKVHSEQFHLPTKGSDVGPGSTSLLHTAAQGKTHS